MVLFKSKKYKLKTTNTSKGKKIYKIVNSKTGKTKEVDGIVAYSKMARAKENLKKVNK